MPGLCTFTKRLTADQREQVEALIYDLGLVPAGLVPDELVRKVHAQLYQKRCELAIDSLNREVEEEYMLHCIERYKRRKNSKSLIIESKQYEECALTLFPFE